MTRTTHPRRSGPYRIGAFSHRHFRYTFTPALTASNETNWCGYSRNKINGAERMQPLLADSREPWTVRRHG
jgi:hypothetical protein